jgi:hypothetical protein
MGQYYIVIILSDIKRTKEIIRTWMSPHNYKNGAKLTEHSYIGNNFVQELEHLISPEGMFYMSRIVWAGDYAEPEKNESHNLYTIVSNSTRTLQYQNSHKDTSSYRYIVNHSQKLYVDKERCNKNKYNLIVHPLPLLVSEGNGCGGEDYRGNNIELCGTWARDNISVEKTIQNDYNELVCDFFEE